MTATSFSPQESLSIAFLKISNKFPYLQSIAWGLVRRETPGLGTLAVSANGILYYDLEAIKKWSIKQTTGVVTHEILHVLLNHNERREAYFANPKIWNMAADVSVNSIVKEMGNGIELPPDCLTEKSFDPPLPENRTAEEYYHILMQRKAESCLDCGAPLSKEEQQAGGDQEGDGSGKGQQDPNNNGKAGNGGNEAQGDGKGGKGKHQCKGSPQVGGGWCGSAAGHKHPMENGEAEKDGHSKADFDLYRKIVAEAIRSQNTQKSQGSVPDGMLRWAEVILAPAKIPWKTKLKRAVRRSVNYVKGQTDYTFTKMSRMQHSLGFGKNCPVIPALHSPVPKVGLAIDTSGSMSSNELEIAVRESNGILKSLGIAVEFYASDCAVHAVTQVKTANDLLKALKGGGGTDFDPVFAHIKKQHVSKKPDILIYITDGIASVPTIRVPDLRVIWLLVGKGRANPGFDPKDIVIELDD